MARMMKSRHHDGVDPNWFHFDCFWPKVRFFADELYFILFGQFINSFLFRLAHGDLVKENWTKSTAITVSDPKIKNELKKKLTISVRWP